MSRRAALARSLLVLLALAAPPAAAQALRVRVVDAADGRPVGGALVALLDESGGARAEVVTPESGRRLLAAPAPGRWRVRVRRIGYAPFVSTPVALAAGDTTDLALRVTGQRVVLPEVAVDDRSACRARPAEAERLAAVWEEVRKALEASELTGADSLVTLAARNYQHWLGRTRRIEVAETTAVRFVQGAPFRGRSAAELSRFGYVVGTAATGRTYHAPDAAALLSDEFARDHCFSLARGDGENAGLLGLRFEPVPGRTLPDIAGTLWVDPRTAELRRLDFAYRNVPALDGLDEMGGRIEFRRLPSGLWIVPDWRLRMPRVGRVTGDPLGVSRAGYRDAGGHAWPVTPAESLTIVADAARAAARVAARDSARAATMVLGAVTGTLFDSMTSAPLVGARIWLPAAGVGATTDSAGRFTVDGVPAGEHRLEFSHPGLDSAGLVSLATTVTVEPDEAATVELATPPFARFRAAACGDGATGETATVLYGTLRDAESGERLAGATVLVSWLVESDSTAWRYDAQVKSLRTETDDAGGYYVCDVPADAQATARAIAGRFEGADLDIAFGARRLARLDIALSRDSAAMVAGAGAIPPAGDAGAPYRPGARGRAVLAGVVRNSAGQPAVEAQAAIEGAVGVAITDSNGAFLLAGLPSGTQMLEVRRIGLAPARVPVTLRTGDTTRVEVDLVNPQLLAPVRVLAARASRELADLEHRRTLGDGRYVGAEEIKRYPHTQALMQNAPGVRVGVGGGGYGDWRLEMEAVGDLSMIVPTTIIGEADPTTERRTATTTQPQRGFDGLRAKCEPDLFIDGRPSAIEELRALKPEELIAVEVYARATEVPARFARARNNCGVVLVWTRYLR